MMLLSIFICFGEKFLFNSFKIQFFLWHTKNFAIKKYLFCGLVRCGVFNSMDYRYRYASNRDSYPISEDCRVGIREAALSSDIQPYQSKTEASGIRSVPPIETIAIEPQFISIIIVYYEWQSIRERVYP